MKKRILVILLGLVMVLGLAACTDKAGKLEFGPYSYTNPEAVETNWRDLAGDGDMVVDGVLNDARYEGLKSLEFITGYNDDVIIHVVGYLGETGLYVGVTVEDDYIFYNTRRAVYNNTSVELHIAQYEAESLDKNVVQLRYGVNGYVEQWVGVKSYDGYAYTLKYVPNMSRIVLTGDGAAINEVVEGQGFVIEAFIPYSSFGLSAKPDKVKIGPAYNHVRDAKEQNSERLHKDAIGMSYTNPTSFAVYDSNGYNAAESVALATEKEIDGDIADWATAAEKDNRIKVVDKRENGKQATFGAYLGSDGLYAFVDAYHETYVNTNTADWWRNTNFELFVNGDGEANHMWVTPSRVANSNVPKGLSAMKTVELGEGDDGYTETTGYHTTAEFYLPYRAIPGYTDGDEYVRLGFAFKTVNDLMEYNHDTYPSGGTGKNEVYDDWWFPMGHSPNNAAQQLFVLSDGLYDALPIIPSINVDGDLSDWNNATNSKVPATVGDVLVEVRDAENAEKGFAVKAFIDSKGLYIAYEAKHALYKTTEDAWFLNTNAEIQLFGDNQAYINAKGQKNLPAGGLAAMNTVDSGVEDSATRYTTTVEFFIPAYSLKAYGYTDNLGYALVGFAFKTGGDNMKKGGDHPIGLDNSDWWWAEGHNPGIGSEQFRVTASGISTAATTLPITVDGDFSDWQGLSNFSQIDASKITLYDIDNGRVNDFGACGYTIWAFADDNGLYVFYKVRHHINPINGDKGWWQNPNAEIFVYGNKDSVQCYISAKPETRNMVAVMNTTHIEAGADANDPKEHYETIVEVYIPFYVYGGMKDGENTMSARIGWKINNDDGVIDDLTVSSGDVWGADGATTHSWWMQNKRNIGNNGFVA